MKFPNKKAIAVGEFTVTQATKIPNSKGQRERMGQINLEPAK